MIHFALISYSPNTAAMNRMRGYWNVMESKGVDVCVSFLHQDNLRNKVEREYKHIRFRYYDGHYGQNRVVVLLAFWYNLLRFSFTLKKGDVVYTYGINKVTSFLLKRKGIKLIAEVTEHPSIPDGGRTISVEARNKYEIAKQLDRLVVISESLKLDFIEKGAETDKIQVVNMTVDSHRFEGITKSQNRKKYIAYCGSVSNTKDGVCDLISSFAIVSQYVNDVYLYIIGKAENEIVSKEIHDLIEQLNIEDKVLLVGQIPYHDMPQMLLNSEVLTLCRPNSIQAKYGFPTKLGEYLLTGNPVVVTKVGDIPLFLKDGESALLANERDPEDFASKLIWVLNHPNEAVAMGQNGKEIAMSNFNAEIETDKLIMLLKQLEKCQ